MYWARYVLVDQALRGGGTRSTERPSNFILYLFHLYVYFTCNVLFLAAAHLPQYFLEAQESNHPIFQLALCFHHHGLTIAAFSRNITTTIFEGLLSSN